MKGEHALVASCGTLLVGVVLASAAPSAYASWTDEGTSVGLQCSAADVNDAGTVVGTCISTGYVRIAFMAATAGSPVALAPLTTSGNGGVACEAGGIDNAPVSSAVIVGSCQDASSVWQAVYWTASNPSATPTLLQPLPILAGLRLAPDVSTRAAATNSQGVIVGVSVDGSGNDTPVVWSSAGVPTALNAPLTGSVQNCSPVDISDAATPAIIGNCPAGAAGAGKNRAVLWTSATSAYVVLPVPGAASYCSAQEINTAGQILGECVYLGTNGASPDTYRTVRWGSGGTGPTVMLTVNGNTSLRNAGVGMNASGQIAGNHLVAGGYPLPFLWDPSTGTNAIGIVALPGGSRGTATGIGDNGVVAGCDETAGVSEAFVSHGGATPIAIAPLKAGGNDCATSISRSGGNIAGASEISGGTGEEVDAVQEATP